MGNQVDEAKTKVRLNKEALASDVDRFEGRVGYLTNVPAQVRRHWPKLVALGAVTVGVVAGVGWRKRHSHRQPLGPGDEEMAAQLQALKEELAASKHESVGRKVAMRAATAAAAAVGTLVARRMADHLFAERETSEAELPDDHGHHHSHGSHETDS